MLMGMGTITSSDRQQRRAPALSPMTQDAMSVGQAWPLLSLSPRQVFRLRESYAENGRSWVVHANAVREPTSASNSTELAEVSVEPSNRAPQTTPRKRADLAGKEGRPCDPAMGRSESGAPAGRGEDLVPSRG